MDRLINETAESTGTDLHIYENLITTDLVLQNNEGIIES